MKGYFQRFIQESKRPLPAKNQAIKPHQLNQNLTGLETDAYHEQHTTQNLNNHQNNDKVVSNNLENLSSKPIWEERSESIEASFEKPEDSIKQDEKKTSSATTEFNKRKLSIRNISAEKPESNFIHQSRREHLSRYQKSQVDKKPVIKKKILSEEKRESFEEKKLTQMDVIKSIETEKESALRRPDSLSSNIEGDIKNMSGKKEPVIHNQLAKSHGTLATTEESNISFDSVKNISEDITDKNIDYQNSVEKSESVSVKNTPQQLQVSEPYQPGNFKPARERDLKLSMQAQASVHIGAIEIQVVEPEVVQPEKRSAVEKTDTDSRLLLRGI